MFLRRNRKRIRGADYVYWTLVECVRTARGPRQRVVATIGKMSDLKKEERVGWEEISRVLSGEPRKSADLFEEEKDVPEWDYFNKIKGWVTGSNLFNSLNPLK